MELNNETYSKLLNLINDAKKNKNYEFEARFWNKKKNLINEDNFNKVFQKLIFSKENNGLGYKYEMKNILDIILEKQSINNNFDSIRMTLNNVDEIKKYWLTSNMEGLNPIFIEKEKLDKIDDDNYYLRYSLNNELPQNNLLEKNKNLLMSNSYEKVFRYKNRYSIKTSDNLFQIDMSSIKMGMGKSFKDSNTLKEDLTYEIEIEFIGKNITLDSDIILKSLFEHCELILKILQNSEILLSNAMINKIKKNYLGLIKSNNPNDFIAASPVTIHRDNLLKSSFIKNIQNNYAVTLKADGDRNFLIVISSDNEDENGKIFIFDNNFNFIDTGYKDTVWTNTLIEAEYVQNNGVRELYMYDILFSKNQDVRKSHLIDFKKEVKSITRLELLDQFEKSNSRINIFSLEKCIKLKNKKYIQSFRADGSDIFQKAKELWDSRKYNTFNVDGIIFVPKYQYYPLRGGSWEYLFKWKPPQLNTIDFLIRVIKDDNGQDIKSPFIEIVERPDGKNETILKQFKTLQLYVTGTKTIFSKNHKSDKKRIPILFNPFNMDNKNNEIYNLAKIILDDDGKMYAFNTITNEKVEIYDNIIVEFSYDDTKEVGFKWNPFKFRKDKTSLYRKGEPVFGNSERTANDIFRAIHTPVTEEMITTGNVPISENGIAIENKPYYVRDANNNGRRERFPYQNFHNHYVKYQLLYFASPSYINEYASGYHGKILDLCCGNGADYAKIKKSRYDEIVGMDYDYNNVKEAQERFKSVAIPPPKAYYVRGDSSKLIFPEQASGFTEADKIYTKKYLPTKYIFDTVSLQFCFHYFFESEVALRSIIQNINDNLKIGGFVIGTTFDGSKVYELLKGKDSIMGKTFSGETMWKIDKKYSSTSKLLFSDKKPNFGKEIDVYVKTIGNVHKEYLVNFEYLDKIMMEYGFSKIFVKPFEDFYNELMEGKNLMDLSDEEMKMDIDAVKKMSEEEKRFSFLSSAFMYKKEKNSSDSLLKKLVELMEKKDKVIKKKGVTKVSEDLEHIIQDIEE